MAIEDLIDLIPPPEAPIGSAGDWSIPEAEFGITFPSDFKEMIRRYGTGEFLRGLRVGSPHTEWGRGQIRNLLDIYASLRDAIELPLVLHPTRPGLFPWGSDSNGNGFFWLTEGDPNEWPIILLGHGEEERPYRSELCITSFLVTFGTNFYPQMSGGITFEEADYRFVPGLHWER